MQASQEKLVLLQFSIAFLLFACTDIQVQQERYTATNMGANEKISFILDRSTITDTKDASKIELKIEKCIDNALNKLEPPVQTVSAEAFQKTAFPNFDYLSVPSSPESFMALLTNREFRNRIDPLGLRYLLILKSESHFTNLGGGLGPGFLALGWNKQTSMSARVLDIAKNYNAGEVQAEALGHGWFAIFILPFGLPAISEEPACNALGKQVAAFIVGNRKKE